MHWNFLLVVCSLLFAEHCYAKYNPIEEYIVDELNKARVIMTKGFPPLVPVLDPFVLKNLNESIKLGLLKFTFEMFNTTLLGASKFRITNISASETAIQLHLDFDFPEALTIFGNFTLMGETLSEDIDLTNGTVLLNVSDPSLNLSLSIAIADYIQIDTYAFDYNFSGIKVTVENVFGSKFLSGLLSDFLTNEAGPFLLSKKAVIDNELAVGVAFVNAYLKALKPT